jgi:hypothetical protein
VKDPYGPVAIDSSPSQWRGEHLYDVPIQNLKVQSSSVQQLGGTSRCPADALIWLAVAGV